MSNTCTPPDDEMPSVIDFSGGTRGKFYPLSTTLSLPVYLEAKFQNRLTRQANAKGVGFSALVNALLRKDIELIEMAKQSASV